MSAFTAGPRLRTDPALLLQDLRDEALVPRGAAVLVPLVHPVLAVPWEEVL